MQENLQVMSILHGAQDASEFLPGDAAKGEPADAEAAPRHKGKSSLATRALSLLGEDYTKQGHLQVMSNVSEAQDAAEIVPLGDAAKGDCNIDEGEANISAQIDTANQVQAKTAKAAAGH